MKPDEQIEFAEKQAEDFEKMLDNLAEEALKKFEIARLKPYTESERIVFRTAYFKALNDYSSYIFQ